MAKSQSIDLVCPDCQGSELEISILKDEDLGAARCLECGRDYLLLDSGDYWFDAIQQRPYPRPSRCACKGTAFRLTLEYQFRDDGDVRSVRLGSTCPACGKSRRQLDVDIDYSPTEQLIAQPLTYCKNPKILYDLHELSLYAKRADIAKVVRFLAENEGCRLVACTRQGDDWLPYSIDVAQAETLILKQTESSLRYLWIYASPSPLQIASTAVESAKQESTFWKRGEIIRISSPTYMMLSGVAARPSLLYYVHFSNEYVKNERVLAKPKRFRELTDRLVTWLGKEFVNWRGKDCFDDPEEHVRAFGDQYRSQAVKSPRRRG